MVGIVFQGVRGCDIGLNLDVTGFGILVPAAARWNSQNVSTSFYNHPMAIPQTFIQELLARTDVVEIVGRYVQLKKGGANFIGLCPFHGEKSPSFSVSPTKQFYHCFGCGKNGNAISFLMEHVGMSFVEAVQDLAQQYGMQIPEDDASPQDRARALEQRKKQTTLTDVLEKAGESYRKHLKESAKAITYLKGRGLSGDVAKQFCLGYAPDGWRPLASVFAQYDDPLLVESGLVISHAEEGASDEKRYDRFRDRIMFPIRNIKGECIGFGGRVLGDEKPKYLNSPETPVFSKGRELYGLYEARHALKEHGYVLVTEGYMDVVALVQLGFPNAVATLGTACTNDHVHKLFRFTDSVVFSFDGDAAGRRAARKALDAALPYASDVRNVKFLFLPTEHDPDSFIRAHGRDEFSRYISEATPLSRFLLSCSSEGCDLSTAEGRAHFTANARPLWTLLPDGALKVQLLAEIASQAQLSSSELHAIWTPKTYIPRTTASPATHRQQSNGSKQSFHPTRTHRTQGGSTGRADHAARILLGHSELWETLSSEEHALLCNLPPPHGLLFTWLETQLHEQGALVWSAWQESLHGLPIEELALHLMAEFSPSEEPHATCGPELRDLVNRLLLDRLNSQATAFAQRAETDPDALARYQEIDKRRKQLQTQINAIIQT
jgi:DNA primase